MAKVGAIVRAWLGIIQFIFIALSLYQASVTLAGLRRRARSRPLPMPPRLPRIAVVICARNEARVIGRILSDLAAQQYPRSSFDVFVVAHNCEDDTAAIAGEFGATVIELSSEPGKLAALQAGVSAAGAGYDLIGVLDADSRVETTLLREVARRSAHEDCLQVETMPCRTGEWLVEGYGLGRRARNALWWRPREALGLNTTISGSGYFIRQPLFASLIDGVHTITEDLEMTARLAANGTRIAYISATAVEVEEPERLADSLRQRTRWARGHLRVVRAEWPKLARRALRGDLRALDTALYLIAPTRLLTRTSVSLTLVASVLQLPSSLALGPVAAAFAGEWVLPAVIAFRERLVPLNTTGLKLGFRHAVLSLLWFPIGAWALVTTRSTAWHQVPRSRKPEEKRAPAAA